ncbi:MAG: hypothetical protein KF819_22340 [Labilithrix sp.]|nr:hypothetical protein [Labilithrix sp.]
MRIGSFALCATLSGLLGLVACSSTVVRSVDLSDAGTSSTTDPNKPDDGGAKSAGSTCEKICAKAASADCAKKSSCVADCEADLEKIPAGCKEEADAAQECAATNATAFKCSSSGKAIVEGGCDDEGMALLQCVTSGGKDSGAPQGCGNISFGSAQCDACVTKNCCAQNAACSASSECLAILDCFEGCTSNACYTACENAHPTGKAAEQAFYGCIQPTCNSACQ